MSWPLVVWVDGEPRSQGSMRSVGRGRMVHQSRDLERWRELVGWTVRSACPGWQPDRETRWELSAQFYVGRRRDLDKLLRAVLDALTGVLWLDDGQVALIGQVSRVDHADVRGMCLQVQPLGKEDVSES
ncbi:MAG TPA: RusA family crossover junction endodeoxyribonuclease [Vicinamibacterales bacterium]|nr:RusA family crossover junction endodeoxyribonuclease [Vicinamibacterales bacterium]